MQVQELLDSPALGLELRTPPTPSALQRDIQHCAPSELLDPTPFLQDDALVITSGMGMNFRDTSTWDAYVERLERARVAALVFATGVAHDDLPRPLLAACIRHGLPLLTVASTVPMLKISHVVDSTLREEHFKRMNRGWALADECARLANRGAELSTILASVYRATQTPVAVFDAFGAILAQFPQATNWTDGDRDSLSIPLPMGLTHPCRLEFLAPRSDRSRLETTVAPVASILALHLANSTTSDAESLAAMRQFTEACTAWSEATRRDVAQAFRELGLSQQGATSIVIADLTGEFASATWQLGIVLHDVFQDVRLAEFDDRLIALAQFPRESMNEAQRAILDVDPPIPLVLRVGAQSIDELRISVVHALHLVKHVTAPTLAPQLGLSAILSATAGRGAREAATKFLAPLFEHDTNRASQLLPTLRAWLQCDASAARTCELLFIHRNSLAYRLRKIEHLLGVDLTSIEGQATCLMALRLVDLEPY